MPKEIMLARTMVELADTLVDDFDIVDFFALLTTRSVELLDVSAAGLMLVAPEGNLRVVASSSEATHLLELFELQAEEGPCLDCYRTGELVAADDLATLGGRWPRFVARALELGFQSAHAVPMRLRGTVIGALNLFGTEPGEMRVADRAAAQALADVATIAILQHRAAVHAQDLNEQLNRALKSRVLIEQAKGMLAAQADIDMDQAFSRLRDHARNHNMLLSYVARDFIEGTLTVGSLGLTLSR
ncbi:MAG: GAF and ANTAR domain-containing protein [Acidimicrobiales bacterium]